jgi:hypothetical protein
MPPRRSKRERLRADIDVKSRPQNLTFPESGRSIPDITRNSVDPRQLAVDLLNGRFAHKKHHRRTQRLARRQTSLDLYTLGEQSPLIAVQREQQAWQVLPARDDHSCLQL